MGASSRRRGNEEGVLGVYMARSADRLVVGANLAIEVTDLPGLLECLLADKPCKRSGNRQSPVYTLDRVVVVDYRILRHNLNA